MAIKKSQLYSTLWEACNALRGGMDASQYKDYVLVILFLKYISDKSKTDSDTLIEVPEGCTYEDILNLKNNPNIGERMNIILEKIADANNLQGVITNADFADENKLGKGRDLVDTVSALVAVFENENLDFSNNRAADDDLIGDAYEYLMRNFASQSGKSKGQFYTPAEVSRIMAHIIGISKDERPMISIYDPACGSGSLLLRAKAEARNAASIDGQEKDLATIGMAKMSMIIHGVDDAVLHHGDTLNDPQHKVDDTELTQFDYVVANPPFSLKGWMKTAKEEDDYGRWGNARETAPVPPKSCGDYAFLLHIIASLKSEGHAACVLPHGVLFRGGSEADIRKFLVERRIISGIIGLPSNLFYGTGIPACIIILDKEHALDSKGIFMINAKDGFLKDGPKNRLREMDIKRIEDAWEEHEDIPHYARFVGFDEIEENGYNLNIPRYVAPEDKEIIQDIQAHFQGGLPKHDVEEVFGKYWDACPSLKSELFVQRPDGYYDLNVAKDKVSDTINANAAYQQHVALFMQGLNRFFQWLHPELYSLEKGFNPKEKIVQWSRQLLSDAQGQKLVDPYYLYEVLLNYWAETMQDDCYMISRDGWKISYRFAKKKPSFDELLCDLLPVNVILDEFFAEEAARHAKLCGKLEQLQTEIEQFEGEYPQETENGIKVARATLLAASYLPPKDGEKRVLENFLPFLAIKGKKGKEQRNAYISGHENYFAQFEKINKSTISKRIRELEAYSPLNADIQQVLREYVELADKGVMLKEDIKTLAASILEKVIAKYDALNEQDIKRLVVEKKWQKTIALRANAELKRANYEITDDINALSDRYACTLPEIDKKLNELRGKVKSHVVAMGINFKEGAMQRLLIGKTRLPGYSGKWATIKFADIYKFAKEGGTPATTVPSYYNPATIPFAKIDDLKKKYLQDTTSYISEEGLDNSSAWIVPENSLLLSNGATLGEVSINKVRLSTKQGILGIIPKDNYSPEFLYYVLKGNQFKRELDKVTTHGTMDCAYLKDINTIDLLLPADIEEQKAIANVLSDMDEEIEALETARDKRILLKQGMMQKLLTRQI